METNRKKILLLCLRIDLESLSQTHILRLVSFSSRERFMWDIYLVFITFLRSTDCSPALCILSSLLGFPPLESLAVKSILDHPAARIKNPNICGCRTDLSQIYSHSPSSLSHIQLGNAHWDPLWTVVFSKNRGTVGNETVIWCHIELSCTFSLNFHKMCNRVWPDFLYKNGSECLQWSVFRPSYTKGEFTAAPS